jgi:hypothetical protein
MIKFIVGLLLGFCIGATATSNAAPKQVIDDPGKCRGNGDGGYRACRINLEGPADKISINVYEDGEFNFGVVFQEFGDGNFRLVK